MRVTSTVEDYLALSRIADAESRDEAWQRDYEAANAEIFEVYYRAWSKPSHRADGVAQVPVLAPSVRGLEERAIALAHRVEQEFKDQGLLEELDLVLLVGNHTSNGWVAEVGGRHCLFLALEYLGDPPFDGVLVSHEAFHVAHIHRGAAGWPEDIGSSLVQEGLATAVSRTLNPGLRESSYLWFDDEHGSWVEECSGLRRTIAALVLEHLNMPADASHVRGLFGSSSQTQSLPSRCGYWLGDQLAQRWLADHPVRQLLDWDRHDFISRVESQLKKQPD